MIVGQTKEYQSALNALTQLQERMGTTEELKAIARLLLYVNTAETVQSQFPWVGTDDPRDRAGIQAYEQAWQQLISDEADEDD